MVPPQSAETMPRRDLAVERRVRPVGDAGHEAVPDRVDPAILDVPSVILVVADRVLPEPALPEAHLAPRGLARAAARVGRHAFGEARLDLLPARREIGIAPRQGPDRVQMVRQDHDRISQERVLVLGRGEGAAERTDPFDPALSRRGRPG